jgi:hypothetical protein
MSDSTFSLSLVQFRGAAHSFSTKRGVKIWVPPQNFTTLIRNKKVAHHVGVPYVPPRSGVTLLFVAMDATQNAALHNKSYAKTRPNGVCER